MNAFDGIIGYESIKTELMQLCDMIQNRAAYEKLGAKLPKGILLHGDPGLGKTLMAKSFITESGLESYMIRRTKGTNDFVKEIANVFERAKAHAPSIVFLDDLDKFANEDDRHKDAEEYVAVQAGIDAIDSAEVVVIATANEIDKLPSSLHRPGRFDRKIEVKLPAEKDTGDIIKHYLNNKELSDDVNFDDITKMIRYSSCAELETLMNEAAINAGYAKRESISMKDIINAVLRMEYSSPDSYTKATDEDIKKSALHEAGHIVICEVLCPGSVGLASIRKSGRDNAAGFMRKCKNLTRRPQEILVSLGGKAAVELYYSEACASGCYSDIRKAFRQIRTGLLESGTYGLEGIDVSMWNIEMSENMNSRNEAVVHAELERYMFKAKDILIKNRDFLEKTAETLAEKENLLYSDIQEIKSNVSVVNIAL